MNVLSQTANSGGLFDFILRVDVLSDSKISNLSLIRVFFPIRFILNLFNVMNVVYGHASISVYAE